MWLLFLGLVAVLFILCCQDVKLHLGPKRLSTGRPATSMCSDCGRGPLRRMNAHNRFCVATASTESENNSSRAMAGKECCSAGTSAGNVVPVSVMPVNSELKQQPDLLLRLHLPYKDEDWLASNSFFASSVVPTVLTATSVDGNYTVSRHVTYSLLAETFGIISPKGHGTMKHQSHNNKAWKLKQPHRLNFAKAAQSGMSSEVILELSHDWHRSICLHNKLVRTKILASRSLLSQCVLTITRISGPAVPLF